MSFCLWHLCWFDIATLLTPCRFKKMTLDISEYQNKKIYFYLGNFKLLLSYISISWEIRSRRSHFSRVDSQNFAKMWQMAPLVSHCHIIKKFDGHPSNSLQDIWWNHWAVKCRSCWPIFILRSKVGSQWVTLFWGQRLGHIIRKHDANPSNSL